MRRIKIVLICFKLIAVPSVLMTTAISFVLLTAGTPLFLIPAAWAKLATTGCLVLFVRTFRSSQFYFFNNLGCPTGAIYGNMILVDLVIASSSFTLAVLLQ